MTAVEVHSENSRRMRDFNRNYSQAIYNASVALPEPPLLLQQDGSESRYQIPPRRSRTVVPAERYAGLQVGAGPDRWGYHVALNPDSHGIGDLWNDPIRGGVWCRVETPSPEGGWEPKWLRVM